MPRAKTTTPKPPEKPADAVILLIERKEGGGVAVVPQTQGDVRLTEVSDVIRLGLKQWIALAELSVE